MIRKQTTVNDLTAKPVFKYIGGKTWMSEILNKKVEKFIKNKKITTYIEPFAGGLGSFLAVQNKLFKNNIHNIVLNDINLNIINLYQQIKNNPENIINELSVLEYQFKDFIPKNIDSKALDKEHLIGCEWFFKSQRELFNIEKQSNIKLKINSKKALEQSARLIFLQRHSFNGIYRENASGAYNTPFNWSAKSANDYENNINNLHSVLSKFNLEFTSKTFSEFIPQYFKQNSNEVLLYLDPPYTNLDQGAENKYSKSTFGINEQKELIQLISHFNFIYSNHYDLRLIKQVKEVTKNNGKLTVHKIGRKNIMTAQVKNRSNLIEEVLIVYLNQE